MSEISNENFDKCILENENARVTVRVQSENKYIAVSDTIVVNGYLAESYGFTDSVEDSVSALDVLDVYKRQVIDEAGEKQASNVVNKINLIRCV